MEYLRKNGYFNSENGITIIVLVITIIVLIILASISIRAIVGDDGIIDETTNAQLTTEKQIVLERLKVALTEKLMWEERNHEDLDDYEYLVKRKLVGEGDEDYSEDNPDSKKGLVNVQKINEKCTYGLGNFEDGDFFYVTDELKLYYYDESVKPTLIGTLYEE